MKFWVPMKKFFNSPVKMFLATFIGSLVFVLGGCGTVGGSSKGDGGKVQVVATISVLQDLVERVGGDRVMVSTIVPVGGSPETFQPSPSDARKISEARVVFQNGAGLERWVGDLVRSAGGDDVKVIELSRGMDIVEGNPHLWLDAANAERYVEKVRDALIAADPQGAETYRTNAREYLAELEKLDGYIKEQARSIPKERRKLITIRDNILPYFAKAYGFELVGALLQNPRVEPSGRKVSAMVELIRNERVPAVFDQPQLNPRLAETIAREADVEVYEVYSDTLAGESGASSYEAMMRTNIDRIKEGLDGR